MTTRSPTARELCEATGDWKYHSDGATRSQSPSDTLQAWAGIGPRVTIAQNAVPMSRSPVSSELSVLWRSPVVPSAHGDTASQAPSASSVRDRQQ
jgi:hypothetical protein